ncbi:hypothetical protein BJ684DRAFT_17087 [Piptocephalis cylindrospora]|uniref:Uncharacterized protein n=1 Tax=Piptocephalis cylindrospora TaxID=1907219 RepID=A0A4P9Y103_9FUNG|nr:hypothetical protein BJ684DRAFT_17087 [Piptocephalis cylindrospora]|eukprot:RKP12425.1 hypothetical protein BJ684DRAFT_17087 [Piptocephalis cylindrospora]
MAVLLEGFVLPRLFLPSLYFPDLPGYNCQGRTEWWGGGVGGEGEGEEEEKEAVQVYLFLLSFGAMPVGEGDPCAVGVVMAETRSLLGGIALNVPGSLDGESGPTSETAIICGGGFVFPVDIVPFSFLGRGDGQFFPRMTLCWLLLFPTLGGQGSSGGQRREEGVVDEGDEMSRHGWGKQGGGEGTDVRGRFGVSEDGG